ncbi:hypothetical protein HXX76_005658 [Chlamydomonas incerta]|uniref:Protein KTI12 homolog n=1 Tax=Chlamydomonas incerta TaxID=51695 RepID=A0A835T600_CHLIN|nr:hypothetical protein HXX76_005658 [Chlamydomonas incerta]|eukprot:KAG2438046.1 hypothetical protein HXX76_005658 [Chlamydomonas incerta]
MPLVVVCGQPCSGKSTVAAKLVTLFQEAGLTVELVDEPSLHLERNAAYTGTFNEKNTRAKLKSQTERVVGRKGVTILDSINNIKGYRYELWCVARAAGTRYCMVHVDTEVAQCRQWNEGRPEGERYKQDIFDDLAGRFERPDARNRWDAPLFTIHPASGTGITSNGEDAEPEAEVLAGVVRAMLDEQPNVQARVARELTPTMATANPALLATNTLHEIDQAAQVGGGGACAWRCVNVEGRRGASDTHEIINAITEAQAAAAGGAAEVVRFPGVSGGGGGGPPQELELQRPVSLAELRRHKRAFLKLATKITFARLQDASAAKRMFVDYLRTALASEGGGGGGGAAGEFV